MICDWSVILLLFSTVISQEDNIAVSNFIRPCEQVSYLDSTANNGGIYNQSVTRSPLECALLCGMQSSCVGFNVCQNTTKHFDCEQFNQISNSFSCDLIEARTNCSFHMTSTFDPTQYLEKAALDLTDAGCPPDAFMLNEYHVCYWAVQSSHSYVNLTACEDTGGYLAVLPSGTLMDKLGKLIDASGTISSSQYYWVDVNDLDEEGIYTNRFGPVSWTAWDGGQPNDDTEKDDQDCVIMSPKYSYEWHDRNCLNDNGYYAFCFYYLLGDGYRKRYVVHTDATNTTYGNLTELIADIDRGVAVRILIKDIPGQFDDLVIQADAIFSYSDVIESRCAQSVHNMASQLGYVLRMIIFACTTGFLRIGLWANGAQTETTHGVSMTWFTSDHSTTNVFQTSGAWNPGFNMTEAIFSGKDVIVQLEMTRYPLHDLYYGVNMTGQFSWIANDGNWTSLMIDSEGYIHNTDWLDANAHTFLKESGSYAYLVSDTWQLVYSNSYSEFEGHGSIVLLANYINSGKEVKVDIGGRVTRVDMIFINTFQIYAMLSSELVSDDMNTDLKRTVTIVSSSGNITTYTFGFDQNTNLFEDKTNSRVRWFVDNSVWSEVHRTEPSRTNYQGLFTLQDGVYAGQPIRLKVGTDYGHNILFTADFVDYSASANVYTARYSRGFAFKHLNTGGIIIDLPVQHLLMVITSVGNYQYITIPNGQYRINTTTTSSTTISWYSKPYLF